MISYIISVWLTLKSVGSLVIAGMKSGTDVRFEFRSMDGNHIVNADIECRQN